MSKILGLDLGTNSIGWAIVDDENNKIIDTGVRIFPMGINLEKGTKEVSKNATRREKRQVRRQTFRRKLRKKLLIRELMKLDMFPKLELPDKELHNIILNEELKDFFLINPYECRAKAYNGEKLTLYELGRIFYHLAQRRGYKESLKNDNADEGKIYEGNPKELKIGITETSEKIKEFGTLGNYLFNEDSHKVRLRNRYTTRKMYLDEFNIVWNNESKFYPEILNEEFKIKFGDPENGILFYQRPLRTQKYLIGKCSFEPDKPRCPISALPFEQFRMYQFINTIEVNGKKLTADQRKIVEEIFNSKEKFEFKEIKKKLKLQSENFNYNNEQKVVGNKTISRLRKIFGKDVWANLNEKDKETIWHNLFFAKDKEWLKTYAKEKLELDEKAINELVKFKLADGYANLSRKAINNILPYLKKGLVYSDAVLLGGLQKVFGKQKWQDIDKETKITIEDTILSFSNSKMNEGKRIDKVKYFLKSQFNLSDKQLEKLYNHSELNNNNNLQNNLSDPKNTRNPIVNQALLELRSLINKIIEIYGLPDEIKIELARDLKSSKDKRDSMRFEMLENEKRNDEVKKMLDEFGITHTRTNIQKVILWKESDRKCPYTGAEIPFNKLFDDGYVQIEHIVPYSISLNNSIQNKTLCLADENRLKGNKTPFQFYGDDEVKWNEVKNRAYKLFKNNYSKYKRFISQDIPDLNNFIERQLNDTRFISKEAKNYLNTICAKVDVAQGKSTSLLRHYWGLDNILTEIYDVKDLDDNTEYFASVKNDKIIDIRKWSFDSKENDLKELAKKGKVIHGITKNGKFFPFKSRDDHRHHAIDAITVALTKKSYLQKISYLNSKKNISTESLKFPLPWERFHDDVELATNKILVSHKKRNKIITKYTKPLYNVYGKLLKDDKGNLLYSKGEAARSGLHEESIFGKHRDQFGNIFFHITKPIEEIKTKKHIDKIVDKGIQKCIYNRLKLRGVKIDKSKFNIPNNSFFEFDNKGQKKYTLFLKTKDGRKVPIKKVRIKEVKNNAINLKDNINQWVEPGNNDHIAIYQDKDGNLREKVVTFWEVVERVKNHLPAVDVTPSDGSVFITSFKENDMYLVGLLDEVLQENENNYSFLSNYLYRVQKLSTTGYKIVFRNHKATKIDNPEDFLGIASMEKFKQLNPIKVRINKIGKIEKVYK